MDSANNPPNDYADVQDERRRLRRRGSAAREALDPARRSAASATVVARVQQELHGTDGVLVTAAVGTELDLAALWPWVWAQGMVLALPRVEGRALVPVAVTAGTRFAPGWQDIPEPVGPGTDVDVGSWVALVPGLAFDPHGNRLGYGGGYYDRFLTAHPGVRPVGVCFACQVVERVPALAHDRPMSAVVTER